jgi:hypothetical protein
VNFFFNKDIIPFAFYANFNHYHFFQFLAKGITIRMSFSMQYLPKKKQYTTKQTRSRPKNEQTKTKIYTDTSQIISEFPFPTDENYEFPTIHLFN